MQLKTFSLEIKTDGTASINSEIPIAVVVSEENRLINVQIIPIKQAADTLTTKSRIKYSDMLIYGLKSRINIRLCTGTSKLLYPRRFPICTN